MPQIEKRKGRPSARGIRWNLQQAEREFGVGRDTLARRARGLSIEPGTDGCYSSRDIAKMLFGDKEAELIANIGEDTRGKKIKNDLAEGKLIETSLVIRLASAFLVPVRQRILSSGLSEDERAEMLDDLVKFGEVDWPGEAVDASR